MAQLNWITMLLKLKPFPGPTHTAQQNTPDEGFVLERNAILCFSYSSLTRAIGLGLSVWFDWILSTN
jgi:hypothetical protein